MPEISIVVPVYNVEDYLGKCVDSILQQTFDDFEVILVNDGSTDQSLRICREYAEKDSRIKVIDKKNGGLSAARNAGLQIAVGKYISFIDSDDFIEPDMVRRSVAKLEETGADIVIFEIFQYYMSTGKKEVIHLPFDDSKVYSVSDTPELLTRIPNAAWNKVYRTDLFRKSGIIYPVGYIYEDLGTTYRLISRAERIAFINEPLYDYLKDRPGNITGQFNQKVYHILDMAAMNIEDFKHQGIYNAYYEEIKYLSCINIMECLKKTRGCKDREMVENYIDHCFDFIKLHWPEFPECRYQIGTEKNDWIYRNPVILKLYLRLKG